MGGPEGRYTRDMLAYEEMQRNKHGIRVATEDEWMKHMMKQYKAPSLWDCIKALFRRSIS